MSADASTYEVQPWVVPETWGWASMGDVSQVVGGGTPATGDPGNFDNGSIPWITPADLSGYWNKMIMRGSRNITDKGLKGSGARVMPAGTVLFSSRAPIGYVAIASQPVSTNQGFKSFVLEPGLDSSYVYYYLKRAKDLAVGLASGTTFLEISGAKAARLPIPLAPLPEQRRIVAEIEKQFSRLDAAVAALKRAQTNLRRYRASVLKAACEGRLVPQDPNDEPASELPRRIRAERSAKTVLREHGRAVVGSKTLWEDTESQTAPPREPVRGQVLLPEGWLWTTLGELFTVSVGATPSRARPDYWGGSVPWVSSGEVAFCRIRGTRETISEAGLRNTSTELHPPGTVLMGMIGEGKTRGQVAILDIHACNNQNSAAIRVSEAGLSAEYVYYYLWGQYERTRTLSRTSRALRAI